LRLESKPPYAYPGPLEPLTVDEIGFEGNPLVVDLSSDEPLVDEIKIERRPQLKLEVEVSSPAVLKGLIERAIRGALLNSRSSGKAPLIHLYVKTSQLVPVRGIREAALSVARAAGVLIRIEVEKAASLQGSPKAIPAMAKVTPKSVAREVFKLHGEDVDDIFDRMVPALLEGDYGLAARIVEELVRRRGEEYWMRVVKAR
jgi:DNA repair exonuclease SbcCD nuclease subunit